MFEFWVDREGGVQRRQRAGIIVGKGQHKAEITQRHRILGRELDGRLLVFNCPGRVSLGNFRLSPQVVHERLLRIDPQRLGEIGLGSRRVFHLQQREPSIRVGDEIVRIPLDCPSEIHDRVVKLSLVLQVHASIVQAERIFGEQLDQLVEGGQRFGVFARLDVNVGQRGPRSEV